MRNKLIITFVCALIAIFGISLFTTSYLKNSTNALYSAVDSIENDVQSSSWQKSSASLTNFKDKWEKSRNTWSILVDHMEIDNIEHSITRLENFIKVNDKNQAIPEAAVLKEQISHIYEKERFNLKNIL